MGELYRLTFNDGKYYIGATRGRAKRRWFVHRCNARNEQNTAAVYIAWREMGEPVFTILAVIENSELDRCEREAIITFRTLWPGGYNMVDGGKVASTKYKIVTDKYRGDKHYMRKNPELASQIGAKGSATMRGLGELHWTKRPEVRRKISETKKGRPWSEKRRSAQRLRNAVQVS